MTSHEVPEEVQNELAELAARIEDEMGGDPDDARRRVEQATQNADLDTTPGGDG